MPLSIPPELKKIAPYIKRAEELDRAKSPESRLVAYYCRQYAVHLGIPLVASSPASKACLGEILGNLETEKPAMDNFTRDEAAFICRKFAENVFKKADEEDRAGRAGKGTAKAFYAAVSFLQILEQFSNEGNDSEQVQEDKKKIIYSKWKSTETLKAIKDGRTPTPGGYGKVETPAEHEGDEDEDGGNESTSPAVETVTEKDKDEEFLPPPAPSRPPAPMAMPPPPVPDEEEEEEESDQGTEVELDPPPAYPGDKPDKVTFSPAPAPAPKSSSGLFGFGKKKVVSSKARFSDAIELTRFALAALESKDADLAAERLQQALDVLR